MKKSSLFFTNLFLSATRYGLLCILSLIFVVIGAFGIKSCLYIGLAILILYWLICLISALHMQRMISYRSDDDPEFNKMMDKLTSDPNNFLSEIINAQSAKTQMHGEDLLTLSDDDLFETVYFQNIDIADDEENEDKALEKFTGARRTVYILSLYDAEIQNGGLCQFFVNSSRATAPYVSNALETVGADGHKKLFDDFITTNNIDVCDLDSFIVFSKRGYTKQTKRFNFDSFDDSYYELPPLQDNITAYIRANINEF